MLQLLNPLWLWAVAGIIVPVLIHLWHVNTGKTLKIGSISLLGESARQSSRSLRITNWLLLLLRCLLLLLLALLLTAPWWQKPSKPGKVKGWILLEKEPVKEVYAHFKTQIDSLLQTGYEINQLDTSFKAVKTEGLLQNGSKKSTEIPNPVRSYWRLLRLLEQKLPQKTTAYLFTSNQQPHFEGKKPELNFNLRWKTYTPADSVSTWIQDAFLTSGDSIGVVLGNSKPAGTSFSTLKLPGAGRSNSRFNIFFEAGKPFITLKNSLQPAVPVDTSTLNITVFQNHFPADAAYLKAALQAVKKFCGRKIKVSTATHFEQIPAQQDWIFCLAAEELSKNLRQKLSANGSIFQYQPGKAQPVNSWIANATGFAGTEPEQIALYQHFLGDKRSIADEKTIWQDGFGQPVLSCRKNGNINVYRFYSRFDPAWNDLVWSNGFPKMILDLVLKSYPKKDFTQYDKRTISPGLTQITKSNTENFVAGRSKTTESTDLKHAFWVALFLLFLLERFVSFRTKKEEVYG